MKLLGESDEPSMRKAVCEVARLIPHLYQVPEPYPNTAAVSTPPRQATAGSADQRCCTTGSYETADPPASGPIAYAPRQAQPALALAEVSHTAKPLNVGGTA